MVNSTSTRRSVTHQLKPTCNGSSGVRQLGCRAGVMSFCTGPRRPATRAARAADQGPAQAGRPLGDPAPRLASSPGAPRRLQPRRRRDGHEGGPGPPTVKVTAGATGQVKSMSSPDGQTTGCQEEPPRRLPEAYSEPPGAPALAYKI